MKGELNNMMYEVFRNEGLLFEALRLNVTADSAEEAREILENIGWTVTAVNGNTIIVK
jgi:hypothetical protein